MIEGHGMAAGQPATPSPSPPATSLMNRQLASTIIGLASLVPATAAEPAAPKDIKAYCLDFNWAASGRKRKPFAKPGTWAGADPAQHVAWYKTIGANVIQTFCVSTNGYAWYKNGLVPEQPGLKHDFLPEVVKLGHQEGMLVFGYFCASANPKWGADHPDQSYGTPTTYHSFDAGALGSTCDNGRLPELANKPPLGPAEPSP